MAPASGMCEPSVSSGGGPTSFFLIRLGYWLEAIGNFNIVVHEQAHLEHTVQIVCVVLNVYARGPLTFALSPIQDMSQIPFLFVLCLFCLSRHNVVAPSLAAPLLFDIRRATMGPGTREDIVTKPDEMRSWTHLNWYEVPPFNVVQMKMSMNDDVFFGNVTVTATPHVLSEQ